MSSINTNLAAMTALQTLNHTNKEMLEVQNRVSTGLRVATAADNAAYWSIATTMKSDNLAVSTVQDALGLGAATADVAVTAMNSAIDTVSEIKRKLVAARAPGLDRVKIQSEITALQTQLQNTADFSRILGPELAVSRRHRSRNADNRVFILARQRRRDFNRHDHDRRSRPFRNAAVRHLWRRRRHS